MTEAEWLACTDPTPMLEFLRGRASDRKLRLFACACARAFWYLLVDERSQSAVVTAERFADGQASQEELEASSLAASAVHMRVHHHFDRAAEAAALATYEEISGEAPECVVEIAIWNTLGPRIRDTAYLNHQEIERMKTMKWLHDIIGNPFRPSPPLPPAVLAWNDGTVPRIAEGIYQERQLPAGTLDNACLAILSDALLDAGCDNEELIRHCRSAGPHVRGCWAESPPLWDDPRGGSSDGLERRGRLYPHPVD
jgi:hypothetical protein